MAYQVFARKYRPLTFDQVLGQDHVIQTLRNAIDQDRIAQAYLFVGPRGTGKTTTARILAKALNCSNGPSITFDPTESICEEIAEGNSLDVLEIDGASNNGVEQVRELRDNAKFAPSQGRYKIYYIDEVHMLTTAAFNALLKTLEEPPAHVKFIFATTEPNKILPTILSRCQRFDLRPIPDKVIADHLLHIAKEESVTLDEAAAHAIAKGADGGMRDAQSMLDQLVAFCGEHITEPHVLDIFGFTSQETVGKLTSALLSKQTVAALNILHEQNEAGKDLTKLLSDLIANIRTLLVYRVDPENAIKDVADTVAVALKEQSGLTTTDRLLDLIDHFAEIDARMKWAPNKKMHFEIGIIKAVQKLQESNLSDVIAALGGDGVPLQTPARANVPLEVAPVQSPAASATPVQTEPPAPVSTPVPQQPVQAAVPVPTPAPAAAEPVANIPVSSGADDWWRQLQAKFPMAFSQALFKGVEEDRFVVHFNPNDFGKDQASLRKKVIEEALQELAGSALRLDVYIDEAVPAGLVATPPSEANLGDNPVSDFAPQATPPSAGNHAADQNGTAALPPVKPPPTEPMNEDEFYNDPLIQKALDIFGGTIEK